MILKTIPFWGEESLVIGSIFLITEYYWNFLSPPSYGFVSLLPELQWLTIFLAWQAPSTVQITSTFLALKRRWPLTIQMSQRSSLVSELPVQLMHYLVLHPLNSVTVTIVASEQVLELHRGQGMDIHWRDTYLCPTEEEYKEMVVRSKFKRMNIFKLWMDCLEFFFFFSIPRNWRFVRTSCAFDATLQQQSKVCDSECCMNAYMWHSAAHLTSSSNSNLYLCFPVIWNPC